MIVQFFHSRVMIGVSALIIAGALGLLAFAHIPSEIVTGSTMCGFQLWFASIALLVFGWTLHCGYQEYRDTKVNSEFRLYHILFGQAGLMVYFLLRSGFKGLIEHYTSVSLPITNIELALLVIAGLYLTRKHLHTNFRSIIIPLLIWLFACLLIAWRELPRDIMLSSDPDQHAFFAHQTVTLGGIPFDQKHWGPNSLHYPGAFSAMNALWMLFSWLDARNLVSAQPLVQSLLAWLVLAELAALTFVRKTSTTLYAPQVMTLALFIFWTLFPSTYLERFFHLEGTARTSALGLDLLCGMCAYRVLYGDPKELPLLGLFAGSLIALLIGLNPAIALLPAFTLCICFLVRSRSFLKLTLAIFFGLSACFCLVFCDPYYFERFTGKLQPSVRNQFPGVPIPPSANLFEAGLNSLVNVLWGAGWRDVFVSEFLEPQLANQLFLICGLLSLLMVFRHHRILPFVLFAPTAMLIVAFVYPILQMVAVRQDLYLLAPYFLDSVRDNLYLWLYFALLGAGAFIFSFLPDVLPPLVCLLLLHYLIPLRDQRKQLNMTARVHFCGSMGCLTPDDKAVFAQLEERFRVYVEKSGGDMDQVPAILVPNSFFINEKESWIFPSGGARALPFYKTFPVAFFYFQGSSEYSVENYKAHVCDRFDRAWLRDRRVRYVFLPSESSGACLRGMNLLRRSPHVVFKQGKSTLIKLF